MVKVEIHFFANCHLASELIKNTKAAISLLTIEIEYLETMLEHGQENDNFRGCPSLLVNGRDFEGKITIDKSKSNCRVYKKGIPTVEEIKNFIMCNY